MRTRTTCRILSATLLWIAGTVGAAAAQTKPAEPPARPDGFHVALLLGTNSSGPAPAALPAEALKALNEAREVLAFKRFEVLDQAVLRADGGNKTTSLKGPHGRLYRLRVSWASPATSATTEFAVAVALAELAETTEATALELLRTTYTGRIGKTAVLGTSKPVTGAGDQALLLLLTPIAVGGAGDTGRPAASVESGLARQPTPLQATEFLRATLSSECGTGTLFQDRLEGEAWAIVMRTQRLTVQEGVLQLERVPVTKVVAQNPGYHTTPGSPRVYRVKLQDLQPNPVSRPEPSFDRQANWLTFRCVRQGCVNVDGNRESDLVIPVCAEKRGDVLRAFQRLIADVGGSARQSSSPSEPRGTLVSAVHVALLRASNAPGPPPAGLAPDVARALQDAAKVGPYKRFELLDQAVVRGRGPGWASLRGTDSRRFGLVTKADPDESVYEAALSLHLFETKGRELGPESPEVMGVEYTAKAGQSTLVWAADTPPAAERPTLVLLVTPLTPAHAAAFLEVAAEQAMAFLSAELFGTCGTEATFSGPSLAWTTLWRTAKVTLRDGALAIERFTAHSAGSSGGARRTYRARLAMLNPAPEIPVAPPANQPGGVIFRCKSPNCVLVEGAGEPLLQIPICPEKRDALIAAMQVLIVAAGGGWESPASAGPDAQPTPADVERAASFLSSTLTGPCGVGSTASGGGATDPSTTDWKLSQLEVRDFVLSFERFSVTHNGSLGAHEGTARSYRTRLADLLPDARRPVSRLRNDAVQFVCRDSECVKGEWGGERALLLYVCEEKRDEVVAAMQTLIRAASGPRRPSITVK